MPLVQHRSGLRANGSSAWPLRYSNSMGRRLGKQRGNRTSTRMKILRERGATRVLRPYQHRNYNWHVDPQVALAKSVAADAVDSSLKTVDGDLWGWQGGGWVNAAKL